MTNAIFVIANPAAGGGRGEKTLARLRSALASRGEVAVHVTERAGDETRLARQAIAAGAPTVVAVGGDGTWSKVAAALLAAERPPRLALIAAGTGNDFAKSVAAPAHDVQRTFALIDAGVTRRVDVGRVDEKFFLVCCGFGFDTAVLRRMQSVRGLRGSARYVYAALRELRAFPGFEVTMTGDATDGEPKRGARRLLLLVIANAQHYGGAFRIAPNARLADGMLDGIALSPVGTLARAGLLFSATRGRHVWSSSVDEYQQARFDLHFPDAPAYNLDGDLYQAESRSLRVECVPSALEVVAPRHEHGRAVYSTAHAPLPRGR